jgi:hypothetical protein
VPQLFCEPVAEAVLDFDVFDEIQNFPRQGVREFLNFLEICSAVDISLFLL